MKWTAEEVNKLAPNQVAAIKGEQLANDGKWIELAFNETTAWGICRGSGKTPYRTIIDLLEPAYKCSCPSRQFPCKHALGLFLIYTRRTTISSELIVPPQWVTEWLLGREQRKQKKEESPEQLIKNVEASNKNRDARRAGMLVGLDDLDIWLTDLMRQGLANLESKDQEFWLDISARMVDVKVNGIAARIKKLRQLPQTIHDWPKQMLYELGDIHLLANAFRRIEELPADLQEEIKQQVGFKIKKDNVLKLNGIQDYWIVLGQVTGEEDNLQFRRVWLKGLQSQRFAVILDFVFGYGSFQQQYITGSTLDGELVFYPGSFPLRAIFKIQNKTDGGIQRLDRQEDWQTFLQFYAKAVSANPWLNVAPCLIEGIIPVKEDGRLLFVDSNKDVVSTKPRVETEWKIVSVSGGNPITVFGEWNGNELLPISIIANDRVIELIY